MLVSLFVFLFQNTGAELVRVLIAQFGSKISLNTCPKGWIYDYQSLKSAEFSLTQSKIGFYHCPDVDKLFLLAYDSPLKFDLKNELGKYNVVGRKIELTCSTEIVPGNDFSGFSYTKITDSSDIIIVRSYAECLLIPCLLESRKLLSLNKPGWETYLCTFNYKVTAGLASVDYFEELNETIYVNMPPTNVRPDNKVGMIDIPINCISEGDPTPTDYGWICEGKGWQSEGHQLRLSNYREYSCVCSVSNTIGGVVYKGSWNGTLMLIAGTVGNGMDGIALLAVAVITNSV